MSIKEDIAKILDWECREDLRGEEIECTDTDGNLLTCPRCQTDALLALKVADTTLGELVWKTQDLYDRQNPPNQDYFEFSGASSHDVRWLICECGVKYCGVCYEGCQKCGREQAAATETE